MTADVIRSILGWCAIINMALLMWWLLFIVFAGDWVYQFHRRWFMLSREQFDAIHYSGMAMFKIAIFLLNVVPYLALHLVSP